MPAIRSRAAARFTPRPAPLPTFPRILTTPLKIPPRLIATVTNAPPNLPRLIATVTNAPPNPPRLIATVTNATPHPPRPIATVTIPTPHPQHPMAEPSKYAENQFLSATEGSVTLMGEFLADTYPRVVVAASENAGFNSILGELNSIIAVFNAADGIAVNQEALLPSRTLAFDDKMASLTRKPDADTNSLLETWDTTIRSQVAYQGPTYIYLLPQGRETLTAGSGDDQLEAGRAFGIRLGEQTTKPALVALKTTVDTFYNAARALRTSQNNTKATLSEARRDLEALRIQAAGILYGLAGTGMNLFRNPSVRVDTLYNINLLRNPPQTVPGPVTDTTWTPATRTLSTTALPPGATRLEAWRQGPGGVAELLEIGPANSLTVTIPALYTFDPGDLYQLWLQTRNSRGSSAPGPIQNWTP